MFHYWTHLFPLLQNKHSIDFMFSVIVQHVNSSSQYSGPSFYAHLHSIPVLTEEITDAVSLTGIKAKLHKASVQNVIDSTVMKVQAANVC